jgi:hypothetical protein
MASDGESVAAPTVDLIGRDPAAAAKRWESRVWKVLYAKNSKLFGEDVARLMQLPYDEAWEDLVAKAKVGNVGAATAMLQIANICKAEATRGTRPGAQVPPASYFYKQLSARWERQARERLRITAAQRS